MIGIGINLASHPSGLGRAATHLAAHGVSVAPEAMLGCLAEAIAAVARGMGLRRRLRARAGGLARVCAAR